MAKLSLTGAIVALLALLLPGPLAAQEGREPPETALTAATRREVIDGVLKRLPG
jgi:hypothetical protein